MPKFVCKHCGMIINNPEISTDGISVGVEGIGIDAEVTNNDIHHFHIKCPVCLGRTDFSRPKPFPTDKPTSITLRMTLKVETRFGAILQKELDRATNMGLNVKAIELPKLSDFKGIPIVYY